MLIFLAGCTTDSPEKEVSAHRNDLVLGASARDFLSDELFTSLEIEIVYVTGNEPTAATLNSLQSFFERYTHKPDGIDIQTLAIPSPQVGTYSTEEIRSIEKKYRTAFSKDETLAAFVFFCRQQKCRHRRRPQDPWKSLYEHFNGNFRQRNKKPDLHRCLPQRDSNSYPAP